MLRRIRGAALLIGEVGLVFGVLFGVFFEELVLNVAGNEFVAGELHGEAGASAGDGTEGG